MRIVGPVLRLWNVEKVEAHVRNAVTIGLELRNARLSPDQFDRCVQFCFDACWRMSGLEADGRSLRFVFYVRGFIRPRSHLDEYTAIKMPPFGSEASAERSLAEFRERVDAAGRSLAFVAIARERPRGAYDPEKGIGFSTFSFGRIVGDPQRRVGGRIDDWFRSDPEFGDTRYEGNRRNEESLEAIAERYDDEDTPDGVAPAPLSRLEIVDQLNPHAYMEMEEEVLARASHARRA